MVSRHCRRLTHTGRRCPRGRASRRGRGRERRHRARRLHRPNRVGRLRRPNRAARHRRPHLAARRLRPQRPVRSPVLRCRHRRALQVEATRAEAAPGRPARTARRLLHPPTEDAQPQAYRPSSAPVQTERLRMPRWSFRMASRPQRSRLLQTARASRSRSAPIRRQRSRQQRSRQPCSRLCRTASMQVAPTPSRRLCRLVSSKQTSRPET